LETLKNLSRLHLEVEEYLKHKIFKDLQKNSFKQQKASLKEGECIILMDYKENFRLGGGPCEIRKVFYPKTQVSPWFCFLL